MTTTEPVLTEAPEATCPVSVGRPQGDAPSGLCPEGHAAPRDEAARAFSLSMVISGIRCVLTYVVFPWVLPAVGHAGGIGPGLGLAVGIVAITSNVFSIRRFMRSGHRYRWYVAAVNLGVIGLLSYLLVIDLADLIS